jgi:hypothetical protein
MTDRTTDKGAARDNRLWIRQGEARNMVKGRREEGMARRDKTTSKTTDEGPRRGAGETRDARQ